MHLDDTNNEYLFSNYGTSELCKIYEKKERKKERFAAPHRNVKIASITKFIITRSKQMTTSKMLKSQYVLVFKTIFKT